MIASFVCHADCAYVDTSAKTVTEMVKARTLAKLQSLAKDRCYAVHIPFTKASSGSAQRVRARARAVEVLKHCGTPDPYIDYCPANVCPVFYMTVRCSCLEVKPGYVLALSASGRGLSCL